MPPGEERDNEVGMKSRNVFIQLFILFDIWFIKVYCLWSKIRKQNISFLIKQIHLLFIFHSYLLLSLPKLKSSLFLVSFASFLYLYANRWKYLCFFPTFLHKFKTVYTHTTLHLFPPLNSKYIGDYLSQREPTIFSLSYQ
jgi:hypothetical protein